MHEEGEVREGTDIGRLINERFMDVVDSGTTLAAASVAKLDAQRVHHKAGAASTFAGMIICAVVVVFALVRERLGLPGVSFAAVTVSGFLVWIVVYCRRHLSTGLDYVDKDAAFDVAFVDHMCKLRSLIEACAAAIDAGKGTH